MIMTVKDKSKAGPITLAVGLITLGLVLLLYNFGVIAGLEWLWKLWPVLLIGLGVEYLLKKSFYAEREASFHVPSFLLILALLIAGSLLYVAASFSQNLHNFTGVFPWSQMNYTHTRDWTSGPVAIKAGEQLIIENQTGAIRLLPAAGNELTAQAVIKSPANGPVRELADRENPEIRRENGQVTVKAPENEKSPGIHPVTDLEVSVPAGVNIYVKSGTGQITAENMPVNLKIDGSTGAVTLKEISGDLEIESNTGRIEVFEPGGDLKVKNNTGSIEVAAERPLSGRYDLESNTGMISLLLPRESDLVLNAESRTGRVSVEGLSDKTDKTGPGDEFHYLLGTGKGQANLRVGTGAVKITVR